MTGLLLVGVRESARMNAVMVTIKVTVILMLVVGGVWFVRVEQYYTPFIPPNTGEFGEFGWSGILRGGAVIFFAYIGFDAVSVAAQEARDPQRDMPVGILGSLAICTLLYMVVSAVMVGLAPYASLRGSPAPMIVALDAAIARADGARAWLTFLKAIVEIGALAGLTSVVTVTLLAQPRIFYAMATDGLLPPWAQRLHPRWRTPHISTLVTGLVVAVAAGLTPVTVLGTLVSIGTLFAFVIVSIGVLVLRRTSPDLPRPFRVPWSPGCRSRRWWPVSCSWPACRGRRGSGCSSGWRSGSRSTPPTGIATACCGRRLARWFRCVDVVSGFSRTRSPPEGGRYDDGCGPGGCDVTGRCRASIRRRACANTPASMGGVSLPVNVFCWLGWNAASTTSGGAFGATGTS